MSGKKNKSGEIMEENQAQDSKDVEHDDETLVPLEQMMSEYTDEKEKPGGDGKTPEAGDEKPISIEQALEEQKKHAADNLEKALRAQAELDNLRKRAMRDIENAHKYALEKFLAELLPVMDSMELGLSAAAENNDGIESLKEGMELTHKMFTSLLEKYNVKVIDPAGEKFNPELHEAVSMMQQDGVASGHVISVMQKGYELNGRLVRPAMVIVAK